MGLSGFGAAAGPKAPYVSAQTGPRQPVLALTWTTLVADAWGFRGLARLHGPEHNASAPSVVHVFSTIGKSDYGNDIKDIPREKLL